MRPIVMLLALFSLPAAAGPFERYVGTPGGAALSGAVEVPLYLTPDGAPLPCVEVVIGDKTFLFGLTTSDATHWVGPDVLAALGIEKPKTGNNKVVNWKGKEAKGKTGGSFSTATVPEMTIGGLVLTSVPVLTEPPGDPEAEGTQPTTAGLLSLPALGLGWAILPSKGVVRFVSAADAAGLVSGIGGATYDFDTQDSYVAKIGKEDVYGYNRPIRISLPIAGKESPKTRIAVDWSTSAAHPMLVPEGAVVRTEGDARTFFATVDLAGRPALGTFAVNPLYEYRAPYVDNLSTGVLGGDVLSLFDIAADPTNKKIAFASAPTQVRVDPTDRLIAETEKALTKPPPKEGETPKPDEPEWKPPVSALSKLAELHVRRGEFDKGIAYQKQVTDQEPRGCGGWQTLGDFQRQSGDLDGAVASFTQASTLFHAWWDLPLEERQEISEELAKIKDPEEKKAHAHAEQPGACHTADSALAAAQFLRADYAAVAEIAKTRLDLDAMLPDVSGNAAAAQGDWAGAHAAYRQSSQLRHGRASEANLGLAVSYVNSGDLGTARGQIETYLQSAADDPEALLYFADIVRKQAGDAAALQAVGDYAVQHATSLPVAFVYYREAKKTGTEADQKKAADLFAACAAWRTTTASSQRDIALSARHQLDLGNLEEAKKLLALAEKAEPTVPGTWRAKAEVAAAEGNAAAATDANKKAALLSPTYPLSAGGIL